jgi:hypothetical protein
MSHEIVVRHDIQRDDTQHNDIQHNDNQHIGLIWDTQHAIMLNAVKLSAAIYVLLC